MVDAEWDQAASAERFEIGGNQSLTMQSSGADTRCRFAAQPSRRRRRRRRAATPELTNFTGATPPCQRPSDAALRLETVDSDPADNARRVVDALERG